MEITHDYIRGLIEGEGCFTFCKNGRKSKIPAFSIGMSVKDFSLLTKVRDKLRLRNRVYKYEPRERADGYVRMGMSILMVRDLGQLKNIIIPLCYKKLVGNKRIQLEDWVSKIRLDDNIPESYKIIPLLVKNGYYDKNFNSFM